MEIRDTMKQLIKGLATGGSIAALLALGVPANATTSNLDSQPLTVGYGCPAPEAGCGGKDKDGKKKDAKKDEKGAKKDAKKDEKGAKKGKKEGKCGEGKCGEGKCG
jgi:hypothetical protein